MSSFTSHDIFRALSIGHQIILMYTVRLNPDQANIKKVSRAINKTSCLERVDI
jgi:hypothetical protein